MTLREIRSSPGAAWAGPLLVFMLFLLLPGLVQSEAAGAPWYRAQPKQWIYPLQTLTTLAAVAFWWRQYTFKPLGIRTTLWALFAGTVGIALWILPSWLYDHGKAGECSWLGFTSRAGDKEAFNPGIWEDSPGLYWSVIIVRFVRMTVAAALAEELFWRGFLWRTVSDPYRDFSRVPFGQRSWKALGAVLVLFILEHQAPDRFAALIYCLIVSGLYVRTKSVGACVIAHGMSNFLLGLYVMVTKQWGFW
jgi:CAAX prenyl protease-like protein